MRRTAALPAVEVPTLALLVATIGIWAISTSVLYTAVPLLGILLAGIAIAQYSSLQHEGLHGHPFRNETVNEALFTPALNLTVPYGRFRDAHLAHHHDPVLTDPYDDPESNYLDPAVWNRLHPATQAMLRLNNTLAGRVVFGAVLGNAQWLATEIGLLRAGDRRVWRHWALHVVGLLPVVVWLWVAAMPWWAYLLATWVGHGLLKIRTFLEHRAHEAARARTVVIEDRGPLALLFLNNNFHVVHHMHPAVPWYRLPAMYRENRAHYLRRNEGYVYRSYAQVIAQYLWRAKDPVPHPLWTGPANGPSDQPPEHRAGAAVVEERHARIGAAVE